MAAETQVYVPLGELMSQELWPVDFFGSPDFGFLNSVAYISGDIFDDEVNTNIQLELAVVSEVTFDLPFSVSLIVGAGPVHFKLTGDDSGFVSWLEADLIKLRLPREVLVPLVSGTNDPDPDPTVFVEIVFPVGVFFDSQGNFDLAWPGEGPTTALALPRCMIGNTGVIISASDVLIRLSDEQALPDGAVAAGIGSNFRGLFIGEATVELSEGMAGAIPPGTEIKFENCFIGTGGFTGKLHTSIGSGVTGSLFGADFTFQSLTLEIEQNSLSAFELAGSIKISVFDQPLDILVGVDLDGALLVRVAQSGGLLTLSQDGVFDFTVDKIEFAVDGDLFSATTSGSLKPTFQPGISIDWPGFRIEELSFDSQGHVRISGGWIDLPSQVSLDLFGFLIEVTRIGFGTNDAGESWIGMSGGVKLVDGVPASASVEGLRILYGGSAGTHLTLEGVGVALEIPNVLKISGKVSLIGDEFKGAVRVELPAISFTVDANFVAGSVVDVNTGNKVKTFATYLQMQLPVGIPLGATGLSFYGLAGLYAQNREPAKLPGEGWYRNPDLSDGWYTRGDKPGITDVANKWRGAQGRMAFGAGIILGTAADNGFAFNGQLLLAFVFPGPVILIDGMANLFKKRSALGDGEANFHTLVVIEPGKSFTAGLDANYKFGSDGELLDIRGSAEAFFDFTNASNWHLYLGVDKPVSSRIRARAFQLFDINAFFMLDAHRLSVGGGWSFSKRWGFKHLSVSLSASMEGAATVSWHPAHFAGSISVAGGAELNAFGIRVGVSVGAMLAAQVFDPFGVEGSFRVALNLPWPLPDISASIHMSWSESSTASPPLPVPVREGSIEHIKSNNTWPLTRGQSLFGDASETGELAFERPGNNQPGPAVDIFPPFAVGGPVPSVPADSKVAFTFTRPVNDPNQIALTQTKVTKEYIGDPDKQNAPYTVQYELDSLELQKWAPGDEASDGSLRWVTIRKGGVEVGEERQLSAAWQPGKEDPNTSRSEQNKLLVNAVTPFDYTSERAQTWQDWFLSTTPGFPCPLAVPELSARFTDPVGTHAPNPVVFSEPAFVVNWFYGGLIADNDLVIPTVLGPIERGLLVGGTHADPGMDENQNNAAFTIRPPVGVEDILIRLGSPKVPFHQAPSFSTDQVGTLPNPFTLSEGTIATTFSATRSGSPLQATNKVTALPNDEAGLETGPMLRLALPEPMIYAEVDVEVSSFGTPDFEAFSVATDGIESAYQALVAGRNTLHFRGHDSALVSAVVVRRRATNPFRNPSARLLRISWRPPAVAEVNGSGAATFVTEPPDGLLRIRKEGLDNVRIVRLPNEGITLLEVAVPADDTALVRRTESSLSRLTKEDPLFEPDNDYRMTVTTRRVAQSSNAALASDNTFSHNAYFHVSGPPGVGAPDLPPDQPGAAAGAGTALADLRLYIAQTLPPTIPPEDGKLLIPRAFYRGFDVGVHFNEPFAELLYLTARRTLTTRLYDVDDNPVRRKDGSVSIAVPSWERSRQATLKESVELWIGLVNGNECSPNDQPPFDASTVVRNQTLSGGDETVLRAETLYQARLVPSLLHESFVDPLPGLIADGGAHRLERWIAENVDASATRWEIASEPVPGSPDGEGKIFFVQESSGNGSSLVYGGALGARDGSDAPAQWSDFRASVVVRWSVGLVGLDLRRATGGDLLRLTLDRSNGERRLVALQAGAETVLAHDTVTFPDAGTDLFLSVDCVGDRVRVFQGDTDSPIFEVSGAPALSGTLALRAVGAANARFTEVRVDDLRSTPSSAFNFDFITSKYTNFHHHLHGFSDRASAANVLSKLQPSDISANAAAAVAVPGSGVGLGAVAETEWRAYDALEAKVLGPAALQTPENVQVLSVSGSNGVTALLVRSPEPLLWERTALTVSATNDDSLLGVPGDAKISNVSFGSAPADESITILARVGLSLAHCRLEWRPFPSTATPDPAWQLYFAFASDESILDDGTQVIVMPIAPSHAPPREPGTTHRFTVTSPADEAAHFQSPGVELRLLAGDAKTVLHQRAFLTSDRYSEFAMQALRKLDGTAFLLFVLAAPPNGLRLGFTFTRALEDEDLPFRQSTSVTPELALLDLAPKLAV